MSGQLPSGFGAIRPTGGAGVGGVGGAGEGGGAGAGIERVSRRRAEATTNEPDGNVPNVSTIRSAVALVCRHTFVPITRLEMSWLGAKFTLDVFGIPWPQVYAVK